MIKTIKMIYLIMVFSQILKWKKVKRFGRLYNGAGSGNDQLKGDNI